MSPDRTSSLTINIRIPGWARNEPVPGSLYRFSENNDEPVVLRVNRKPVPVVLNKGYVSLSRSWKRGDLIEVNLPMPVRRIIANDLVKADKGRVALQRGPIVYAAEWPDNPDGRVRNLVLADTAKLTAEFKADLLNGVEVVKAKANGLTYNEQGQVVKKEQDFTAIPYFAWANRGPGEMIVWISKEESNARPLPWPTISSKSTVSTSGGQNPRAINDQSDPQSSNDASNSFFHWWPRKGTTEWVEFTFEKPSLVSETELYWFDDTGTGQCRVPKSWRILYKDGDQWKPVENSDRFGIEKDRYNKLTFKAVTTSALRLEVTLQPEWSAGIQEWKVK